MPADTLIRVAILTPDAAGAAAYGEWRGVFDRLAAALAAGGMAAVPIPWTAHAGDPRPLLDFSLVLPLLAWGYHHDHARWLEACAGWQDDGVRIANPPSVLAWNSDKRYLAALEQRGIAIPPTPGSDRVDQALVDATFEATGAEALIVKPTISGGAWKTQRLRRGERLVDAHGGATMLQPYLPAIETAGETSLLFFDGRFSHAVNKRPVPGDFRIQSEYGGDYRAVTPPPAALALARQVLAAVEAPLLYARIDLVPDAGAAFAAAVRAAAA
jgi:hypothetical protein